MRSPPLSPPIVHPARAAVPVLLSVPHAGRDYPEWLLELSTGGRECLHPLEDPLVDRLVAKAVAQGIGAVIARAPRAAVDCNRGEDELDPTVVAAAGPLGKLSPRARGGLGIVPGRTASHGPLWRRPIGRDQLEERLDQAHRPFHRAIAQQLAGLTARFGCAVLLDCHSMPPPDASAQVVVGDRYGRTAAPWLTKQAVAVIAGAGYRTALNDPFAGGHVVERHGAPGGGVHALQIEIDRRCYLKDNGGERAPDFARTADMIVTLALALGERLLARRYPQAAE